MTTREEKFGLWHERKEVWTEMIMNPFRLPRRLLRLLQLQCPGCTWGSAAAALTSTTSTGCSLTATTITTTITTTILANTGLSRGSSLWWTNTHRIFTVSEAIAITITILFAGGVGTTATATVTVTVTVTTTPGVRGIGCVIWKRVEGRG